MQKETHNIQEPDVDFEVPLRPRSIEEFVGQDLLREKLKIYTHGAKERQEALGHALFFGPPGLGKTTLAHILSKTMGTQIIVTSGPVIDKPKDLAGILTNLQKGDILFIDEIHRLSKSVEEYLYPAMEDFSLDLLIDSGPNARSVQINLNPFTLIGATTKSGLLSSPMRSRFEIQLKLNYYSPQTLSTILLRSAKILKVTIEKEACLEIASRSRGTPRIANNHLRWVRDFGQFHNEKSLSLEVTKEALKMRSIDEKGLDEIDKKLLSVLIEHYNGGPVGISTLALAIGEEISTIEEVHEPYLILQGFIQRTPRGRMATNLAYKHLGYKKKGETL